MPRQPDGNCMIKLPVSLKGDFVMLEPLRPDHLAELCEIGLDESLWRWTQNLIAQPEDMRRYIVTALKEMNAGVSLPFVIRDAATGRAAGSTRFGNIDALNRKTEIGWTWIAPEWQRTHVNTECKMLMLTHAFEVWRCVRVEFKTDKLNQASRTAILRIGARQEGILRRHMITESGRFRDTVYFSIIEDEWPDVRSNLRSKLSRRR